MGWTTIGIKNTSAKAVGVSSDSRTSWIVYNNERLFDHLEKGKRVERVGLPNSLKHVDHAYEINVNGTVLYVLPPDPKNPFYALRQFFTRRIIGVQCEVSHQLLSCEFFEKEGELTIDTASVDKSTQMLPVWDSSGTKKGFIQRTKLSY